MQDRVAVDIPDRPIAEILQICYLLRRKLPGDEGKDDRMIPLLFYGKPAACQLLWLIVRWVHVPDDDEIPIASQKTSQPFHDTS